MRQMLHLVFQALQSRLLLNIMLWVALAWMIYGNNVPDNSIWQVYLYKTITLVSMIAFTCINNFILIPRYLEKKRLITFLSLALVLVVGYAFLYTIFILKAVHDDPAIRLHQIILFSVNMESGWSLAVVRSGTIGYSIVFAIWLFIFTMAWYMQDYARQRRALQLALQKQTETELNFLKTQINPHFLFNTLNNLYALALQKSEKSSEAILKLSSVLRYLLYDSNTSTAPFEKEQEIIQAYIAIELLRLENNCQLKTTINADVPTAIPPLLWLPVLENLFKHGARTIAADNDLEFRFEIADQLLTIYSRNKNKMLVRNEGYPSGIGLKNLEKRLELLYPGMHDINITQTVEYYILTVTIKLN
jgi:two-component system LytT family sensor kinase